MQNERPAYVTRQVIRLQGIAYSDSHLRTLERTGQFPGRIQLSPRKAVYRQSDIDRFLSLKAAGKPWTPAPEEVKP